ncbi:hypothetical protein PIB30_062871 [Stylosanthes scabra]|uniref:Uncharacterized protein n=1 Tax=Stylosanthes scabra TaxID=79078 RepID=A0ABU6SM48_9FABA|nr:hypothetical protein [Stylosanthes scabra]
MRTHHVVRMHPLRRGCVFTHTLHYSLPNLLISLLKMAPKGKAKVHQPPTRFSLRLAALKTRQCRDKAGPSRTAPMNAEPIEISSDSESEESDDEEVPEYIPEDGPAENQDLGEEEAEGPGADHEMDPNPDPEEPEEDPKEDPEEEEDPEEDPEMGKMEEEAEQDPNDDEDYVDYFELAPPPSPDSSAGSPLPEDD